MLAEAPKENFYLMGYVFIHAKNVIERVRGLPDSKIQPLYIFILSKVTTK